MEMRLGARTEAGGDQRCLHQEGEQIRGKEGERRVKKREKRRNLSLGTKIRPWIFWEPQGRVLVSKVHQV